MKKIIKMLILSILLIIPFNLKATIIVKERNESNNYGINKKWNIDESNINNIKNTKYVNADEKIYDFSEVLTEEEKEELKNLIDDYIVKTNLDMVILIDSVPYDIDSDNEEYAVDFYDYNDFGIDFENYSGVILFRNTYENDPYYNIYIFGNAQLIYSYQRCEYMLDIIYPYLKNHNYLKGFSKFINIFTNYYNEGTSEELKDYYVDDMGYLNKAYKVPCLAATIIASIVTLVVLIIMCSKNKMIKKDAAASEYLNKKSVKFTKNNKTLISSHTTHYKINNSTSSGSSHSSSGSSHTSSRGSSGGGHSSGGGRHG